MRKLDMGDVSSIYEAIEDRRMSCESFLKRCQKFYDAGCASNNKWLPIAVAPRDGYYKPVRLWADGYPLWVAGFWSPIAMVWADVASLGTLDPQPTHFQHLSPPPENTP